LRFLSVAEAALGRFDYETATSRAYYALLHAVKAVSLACEHAKRHDSVWRVAAGLGEVLMLPLLPGARSIRASFSQLQAWREDADYASNPGSAERAGLAVRYVREVIERLEVV